MNPNDKPRSGLMLDFLDAESFAEHVAKVCGGEARVIRKEFPGEMALLTVRVVFTAKGDDYIARFDKLAFHGLRNELKDESDNIIALAQRIIDTCKERGVEVDDGQWSYA